MVDHGSLSPPLPRHVALAFPRPGQYLLFRGDLLHGVLVPDGADGEPGLHETADEDGSVDTSAEAARAPGGASGGEGRGSLGGSLARSPTVEEPRRTLLLNYWREKPAAAAQMDEVLAASIGPARFGHSCPLSRRAPLQNVARSIGRP